MAEPDQQPPLKTYRGNCHCGAFVYEADLPEIKAVGECNCSVCYKKGYLWTFPGPDAFRIVKGDDKTLSEYTFNTGSTIHKFCPNCGSPVMAVRPDAPSRNMALNVRSIQGLNTWELERQPFDGLKLEPAYQPPKYTGPEPVAEVEGGKLYEGSCHCGAVTLAVNILPLDKDYPDRVLECNCSLCERNGYVWAVPKRTQVAIQGEDSIQRYRFARRMLDKTFCKRCGVPITNDAVDLTDEEVAALSEPAQGWYQRALVTLPINVRVLNGFDYRELKETEKLNGREKIPPPYVNP